MTMHGFQRPLTVMRALDSIRDRSYLLPAIQRRFVWSSEKVEALFDSLMQGYPINSFMFWSITDPEVKRDVRFYDFLQHYREYFKETNAEFTTCGHKDFFAVIDGQQRLTALYLGLAGSYAYKLPRVWLKDNEANLPTRHLYLDLLRPRPTSDEQGMVHDFRFRTAAESRTRHEASLWFKVSDIVQYATSETLDEYMDEHGLNDKVARRTLRRLREVVHHDDVINYYVESHQDIDRVLDIFIRTNSGGVPLSYSDLLMSYTTAQWRDRDARSAFDRLVNEVAKIGSPGFIVTKDFILKTCLALFARDVRFKLANLNSSVIASLETNWERAAKAIIASFEFLADLGFNELNLRAKTPVVPIVQYIYIRGVGDDFAKPQTYKAEKADIRKWLCMSILKGVFRSQTDHTLNTMRKLVETCATTATPHFPLEEFRAEFQRRPNQSLLFDDAFVTEMLRTEIGEAAAFPLLTLLYSHLDYSRQRIDIDHLHSAAEIGRIRDLPMEERPFDWEFVTDRANWNSVANLQPLNESLNRSKQDKSLADWVAANHIDRDNYLLPKDVGLDIGSFKAFIKRRRELLAVRLREVVEGQHADKHGQGAIGGVTV